MKRWRPRLLILFFLCLAVGHRLLGQLSPLDIPISFVNGHVSISEEENEPAVCSSGIKFVSVWELTKGSQGTDSQLYRKLCCLKNGSCRPLGEDFPVASFNNIVYDAHNNVSSCDFYKTDFRGCSVGGHSIIITHYFVHSFFEKNKLTKSVVKRHIISPAAVVDTDKAESSVTKYEYNRRGQLIQKLDYSVNPSDTGAVLVGGECYGYNAKGRKSWQSTLQPRSDLKVAKNFDKIADQFSEIYARQTTKLYDSFINRDFKKWVESDDDNDEEKLQRAVEKRDSIDNVTLAGIVKWASGITTSLYDRSGCLVKRTTISLLGPPEMFITDTFTYDGKRQMTSWQKSDLTGDKTNWLFNYDNSGRVIQCIQKTFKPQSSRQKDQPEATKTYTLEYNKENWVSAANVRTVSELGDHTVMLVLGYEKY